MALDYHLWASRSMNTPPLSSSTVSIIVPRQNDSSRHKQQNLKSRAAEEIDHGFDVPEGFSYRHHLPLSPDPTSFSGQSTGQDASTRCGSRSPERTSYYDSAVVPEVVVTIKKALRLEPGQLSVKSPSAGSSIAGRPSVTKTYRKTDKVVKAEKHVGHKTDRKTSALSQRGTSGKQPGRYGVMAAPKAVELVHLPSSLSQEDRPRKRLRLEDKHATQGDNIKVVKSATQGHSTKKTERFTGKNAEHHTGKKHKFSTVTTMTTTTITKTTSATTSQIRSVTGHPHAAVSKHRLGIISLSKSPVRSTATSRSAAASAASEFTSRFRVKDRIDYRIKLALSLKTPGEPSNSKSKGKAIRKKITPSGGDAAVVKPRAPSPFPAWHLTTSALAKAGEVPEVDMKEVEGIPEDECYVFIPIYEPKTNLIEPELIPDRFDARLNHPALRVNELLQRAVPLACGWQGCDAVLACEPILDKHIHKCGHISKALVVHRDYFEPDAWICQWEGCRDKAFANEGDLEQHVKAVHISAVLYCPFANCTEEPNGFPKMSLLGAHVRKSHTISDPSIYTLKPLVSANDNEAPPTRHSDPLPSQSQPYASLYVPVCRPVWRSEARKKFVIDLVADRSFIDKLDVKMQAGNIEMLAGISSDADEEGSDDDTENDSDVTELEEDWKDYDPNCGNGFDPLGENSGRGIIPGHLPIPSTLGVDDEASGSTTPHTDIQKRRSTRLNDVGPTLMSENLISNALRDPRDPGYCVLIPVTRDWVALQDGPESL